MSAAEVAVAERRAWRSLPWAPACRARWRCTRVPRRGERRAHVAHGHRLVDAGPEQAAGDFADALAVARLQLACGRAPARAPAPPGRRACAGSAARAARSCASTFAAPGKPPARAPPVRRTFCMAQFRPASTGVVVVSMSLPYRHRPASRRSELRAPRPTGLTSGCASRARARASACVGRHRDLEAVFAGVAAAGDEAVAARRC